MLSFKVITLGSHGVDFRDDDILKHVQHLHENGFRTMVYFPEETARLTLPV